MSLRPKSGRDAVTAGKRDRLVTIERKSATLDDYGGEIEGWAPLIKIWSSAAPVRDSERWQAGELAAHITMRFVLPWNALTSTIDPRDRIVFDGVIFDIAGVKEIGRREGVEISAAARADKQPQPAS